MTIFGLIYVAFDISNPAVAAHDKVDEETAVNVFSPLSKLIKDLGDNTDKTAEVNINHFVNTVFPFLVYLLACGGFIFLILENIKLLKMTVHLNPINRLIWTVWIVVLGLLSLLPVYLGTSLIFEGLWYIFIIIAVLCLCYWAYWATI